MLRSAWWLGMAMGLAGLAACDDHRNAPTPSAAPAQPTVTSLPAPQTASLHAPVPVIPPPTPDLAAPPPNPSLAATAASASAEGQAIETAAPGGTAPKAGPQPLLLRVQVLLGRAHFSAGAIDGRPGSNLTHALASYRAARGLPAGSGVDAALLQSLTANDTAPVTRDYTISDEDVKGPFLGDLPKDLRALAKLDRVGYATPREALAERFHMSEPLLAALNPDADFGAAGTRLVVMQAEAAPLPPVARVEVDKSTEQVRALDAAGQVVAAFPATVGSTERPAPTGEWAVKSITRDPNYNYDPSRLTWGPRRAGKLTIAPGPNNPVGAVWIALTAETYGIHGSPDPTLVGKTASHGCVRLTNWDALSLAGALARNAPVDFVGQTART